MRHYDTVMPWVGLFLFGHDLATFAGSHVNRALLFPMEEVFEDFVTAAVRRHQRCFTVGPTPSAIRPSASATQAAAAIADSNLVTPVARTLARQACERATCRGRRRRRPERVQLLLPTRDGLEPLEDRPDGVRCGGAKDIIPDAVGSPGTAPARLPKERRAG